MVRFLCAPAFAFSLMASSAVAQDQAAAAPTDLIATLNGICIAAQGDAARTAALAGEHGFSPTPSEMVPYMRNSADRVGFVRSTSANITYVMSGVMTRKIGGQTVRMNFCGVSARPTDHRALDRQLRQVMGFAPANGGGFEAYAWLQTSEGRASSRSLSDAQFLSMATTGRMRMIGLDRAGPGSTLIYFLPRID